MRLRYARHATGARHRQKGAFDFQAIHARLAVVPINRPGCAVRAAPGERGTGLIKFSSHID